MKKKMKLNELKVNSFVTNISSSNKLVGGVGENKSPLTEVICMSEGCTNDGLCTVGTTRATVKCLSVTTCTTDHKVTKENVCFEEVSAFIC